jgi:predicted enzyme related to lactoylglutathione lyase
MRNTIMALMLAFNFAAGEAYAADAKAPPADVGAGRIAWFDISSGKLPQSREFYEKMFDWQFAPVQGTDQAFEIIAGGTPIGTLRSAAGAISPFNGVVYVQVPDILASYKKAKALGAIVIEGFPFNLPDGTGAIALVVDPAGHPLGMYSRTPLPPAPTPTPIK